jgi:hypothetical protein
MSRSTELILGIASVAMFVAMVIAVPIVVSRLPADYFVRPEEKHSLPKKIVRNVLGALLIAAGIAMLVLPGQGIITILFGLSIIDLPVKRRIFRWLLQRRGVEKAVQLLREKAGQPAFIIPAHAHA